MRSVTSFSKASRNIVSLSLPSHRVSTTTTPNNPLFQQHTAWKTSRSQSQLASLALDPEPTPPPQMSQQPQQPATTTTDATSTSATDAQGNWFIVEQVLMGSLSLHRIETAEPDPTRSIELRRAAMEAMEVPTPTNLPVHASDFDSSAFYSSVSGANCESVIGFLPVPVGVVGPVLMNGNPIHIPMATTEGALIASANRGARAISKAGGLTAVVTRDAMARAPVLKTTSILQAAELKKWVESEIGLKHMQDVFATTSRFGRIEKVTAAIAGRNVFVRFSCFTGDAMGMNMISKGVNTVIGDMMAQFEGVEMIALSGNMCTDKKPSAINWIEGRGKSVTAEVVLPEPIVKEILKADIDRMVEVNKTKNLIGSCLAGSIGGNNAHAANLVAATFLATGQDIAQVVESSTCMTTMDAITDDNGDKALLMTINMPSIEVGTVGGGTGLTPQASCLDMMGLKGAGANPGDNARQLALVVAAGVMAGELSLMAALSSNHLVSAHMALNRKPAATAAETK